MKAVRLLQTSLLCLSTLLLPLQSSAHGSITPEGDICVIRIGFYTAHFKIFQPETSGTKEFCEDLPSSGESIFVMEYLHQSLGEVPIEFRIIRNPTGLGKFTKLEDLEEIDDIEALTVFHREAVVETDVYTINHKFLTEGDFLGIVTAQHPQTEVLYMAVFPFYVGKVNWGWVPLILGLALLSQLGFWFANGTLKRWYGRLLMLPLLMLCLAQPEQAYAQEQTLSESGAYRASLKSELMPVPLNQIHTWVIHVETADGSVVEGASLKLEGGMPAHNHGLPTAPVVSDYLGDGNYRVEGVRFHMMGDWVLRVSIAHQGKQDTVIIPFTL